MTCRWVLYQILIESACQAHSNPLLRLSFASYVRTSRRTILDNLSQVLLHSPDVRSQVEHFDMKPVLMISSSHMLAALVIQSPADPDLWRHICAYRYTAQCRRVSGETGEAAGRT